MSGKGGRKCPKKEGDTLLTRLHHKARKGVHVVSVIAKRKIGFSPCSLLAGLTPYKVIFPEQGIPGLEYTLGKNNIC